MEQKWSCRDGLLFTLLCITAFSPFFNFQWTEDLSVKSSVVIVEWLWDGQAKQSNKPNTDCIKETSTKTVAKNKNKNKNKKHNSIKVSIWDWEITVSEICLIKLISCFFLCYVIVVEPNNKLCEEINKHILLLSFLSKMLSCLKINKHLLL